MVDEPTPASDVRLLIAIPGADEVFTDNQIDRILAIEGGRVKLAAASALTAIAVNEALVSKVIRDGQLSTDGAKLAAELRAQAAALRASHASDVEDADEGFFDVIGGGCLRPPELTEWPRY